MSVCRKCGMHREHDAPWLDSNRIQAIFSLMEQVGLSVTDVFYNDFGPCRVPLPVT